MRRTATGRTWLAAVGLALLIILPLSVSAETDIALSDQASAEVDAGDLTEAAALYTQLLQQYPTSPEAPEAQIKLAYIKMKTSPQSDQEIIGAFSEVRTKYPSSPEAAIALARIGYQRSKSNTTQAISDFNAFLTAHPDHSLAGGVRQSLGRLYLKAKNLDQAEAAFDAVKTTPGASVTMKDEAALQSGFVKIMRFHATKNKAHLVTAIEALSLMNTSPRLNTRARADLGIAEALLLQGKALDARAKYRAAAQAYASDAYFKGFALYGAAICSQEAHDEAAAIEEYTAFLNAQTGATLAEKHASWKAVALQSTSRSAQINVQAKNAWSRLPASDAVQQSAYLRGECLYAAARFVEAGQQFQEVMTSFPETDIARQAEGGLKRCQMAKGGR